MKRAEPGACASRILQQGYACRDIDTSKCGTLTATIRKRCGGLE